VNRYVKEDEDDIHILRISEEVEAAQRRVLADLRADRDEAAVVRALDALKEGAAGTANLMELIVAAARVRATEGEMVAALREVFGDYREPAWI
jgi:methylmalonyl-CoA mutase N-terminal domain/subunit